MASIYSSVIVLIALYTHCMCQKYMLVKQLKTVDEGETYCQQNFGTSLASIHSETDNIEANQLCTLPTSCVKSASCPKGCAIGLNDKQYERISNPAQWQWTDNSLFHFSKWNSGEPNNYYLFPDGEDCVLMYANNDPYGYSGTWNDIPCDGTGGYEQWFLCNSPTVSPTNAPTVTPTRTPTVIPTNNPTVTPTTTPSQNPSKTPSISPTNNPTQSPTVFPSVSPSKYPTINPAVAPSQNPTLSPTNPPSIFETIELLHNTEEMYHSHIAMDSVYIFGGIVGTSVFLFLCVCCVLIIGIVYLCKRKNKKLKNKLENNNDTTCTPMSYDSGNAATNSMIHHQHHYYHHKVQLSEDVVNTIQIGDNEEGEETSATLSQSDDLNIECNQQLLIISDESDHELSAMYTQPMQEKGITKRFKKNGNGYECSVAVDTHLLDEEV